MVQDLQLDLFGSTQVEARPSKQRSRPQLLYRWQVATGSDVSELRLIGSSSPDGAGALASAPIVSFDLSNLRAIDSAGLRYRLLSPRSLRAVTALHAALPRSTVKVTRDGLLHR
jgi:hypothetical protein